MAEAEKKEKKERPKKEDRPKEERDKKSRRTGDASAKHEHKHEHGSADGDHHHHSSRDKEKDIKSAPKEKKERSDRRDDRKERKRDTAPSSAVDVSASAPVAAANGDVDHGRKLAEMEALNQKISAVRSALEAERHDIEQARQTFEAEQVAAAARIKEREVAVAAREDVLAAAATHQDVSALAGVNAETADALQQIEKSRASMLQEIEELTQAKIAWDAEKVEDEARVSRRKARDEEERAALEEDLLRRQQELEAREAALQNVWSSGAPAASTSSATKSSAEMEELRAQLAQRDCEVEQLKAAHNGEDHTQEIEQLRGEVVRLTSDLAHVQQQGNGMAAIPEHVSPTDDTPLGRLVSTHLALSRATEANSAELSIAVAAASASLKEYIKGVYQPLAARVVRSASDADKAALEADGRLYDETAVPRASSSPRSGPSPRTSAPPAPPAMGGPPPPPKGPPKGPPLGGPPKAPPIVNVSKPAPPPVSHKPSAADFLSGLGTVQLKKASARPPEVNPAAAKPSNPQAAIAAALSGGVKLKHTGSPMLTGKPASKPKPKLAVLDADDDDVESTREMQRLMRGGMVGFNMKKSAAK